LRKIKARPVGPPARQRQLYQCGVGGAWPAAGQGNQKHLPRLL